MRRLDRLILGELIGPWAFGAAIFTVLIMAGTYLFKITDYVAQGISMATVIELTILLLPGVMAKTFSMATLLAALLAFGRLSSDSEIVALRAAGASLGRIMLPVAVFGVVVSVVTFWFNETLVPGAAMRATVVQTDVAKQLRGISLQPISQPVYEGGVLKAIVSARDFSLGTRTLRGAQITTFDDQGDPAFVFFATELEYRGPDDWKMRGGGRLLSYDGQTLVDLKGDAWPEQVETLSLTFEDLVAGMLKDLDSLSMEQMRQQIVRARENTRIRPAQIANLEYGYYNKVALPLAALVFGLVGAPLGIRNHRTGAAAGFWMSIMIIFGYMLLTNFMAVYAQGGAIPSYTASFTPLLLGLVFAAVTIRRKNQ